MGSDSILFPKLEPSGRLRGEVKHIIAVRAGPNPSFDYYLLPRLRAGSIPFEVRELERAPGQGDLIQPGSLVLFCRYLSSAWLDLLERNRSQLAGTALFLDDDVDALLADWTVPVWYRLRLYRRHLRFRSRLRTNLDLLLVSNERIARRHGITAARILTPLSAPEDEPADRASAGAFRVAFHATSIHRREHWWLRSVLRTALTAEPRIEAEIVAPPMLGALWRGLPRTRVVGPRPWLDFRAETAQCGADLLLCPLLPSAANAARAATKRIDALRLGAAILVNDAAVYGPTEDEARLGMCVPADAAAWSNAIVGLARDPTRLARLRELNRAVVERQNADPGPSFAGLFAAAARSE